MNSPGAQSSPEHQRLSILIKLAEESGLDATAARGLRQVLESVDDEPAVVAVVGEQKSGKSTLINALIGAALLPGMVRECTALPARLREGAPRAELLPAGLGVRRTIRLLPAPARWETEAAQAVQAHAEAVVAVGVARVAEQAAAQQLRQAQAAQRAAALVGEEAAQKYDAAIRAAAGVVAAEREARDGMPGFVWALLAWPLIGGLLGWLLGWLLPGPITALAAAQPLLPMTQELSAGAEAALVAAEAALAAAEAALRTEEAAQAAEKAALAVEEAVAAEVGGRAAEAAGRLPGFHRRQAAGLARWILRGLAGPGVSGLDLWWPSEALRGIVLVDTPGWNTADPARQQQADWALRSADVCVLLSDLCQPASRTTLDRAERLAGTHILLHAFLTRLDRAMENSDDPAEIQEAIDHATRRLRAAGVPAVTGVAALPALGCADSRSALLEIWAQAVQAPLLAQAPEIRLRRQHARVLAWRGAVDDLLDRLRVCILARQAAPLPPAPEAVLQAHLEAALEAAEPLLHIGSADLVARVASLVDERLTGARTELLERVQHAPVVDLERLAADLDFHAAEQERAWGGWLRARLVYEVAALLISARSQISEPFVTEPTSEDSGLPVPVLLAPDPLPTAGFHRALPSAALGAGVGGAAGAAMGTALLPGFGTLLGGALGALAGGFAGSLQSPRAALEQRSGIWLSEVRERLIGEGERQLRAGAGSEALLQTLEVLLRRSMAGRYSATMQAVRDGEEQARREQRAAWEQISG